MAWRFLSRISERDAVDYCLYELPPQVEEESAPEVDPVTETSSLLPQFRARDPSTPTRPNSRRVDLLRSVSHVGGMFADSMYGQDDEE